MGGWLGRTPVIGVRGVVAVWGAGEGLWGETFGGVVVGCVGWGLVGVVSVCMGVCLSANGDAVGVGLVGVCLLSRHGRMINGLDVSPLCALSLDYWQTTR